MVLQAIEINRKHAAMPETPLKVARPSTPRSDMSKGSKKQTSHPTDTKQRTLLGFFQKATPPSSNKSVSNPPTSSPSPLETKVSHFDVQSSSPALHSDTQLNLNTSSPIQPKSEIRHEANLTPQSETSRSIRAKRRIVCVDSDEEQDQPCISPSTTQKSLLSTTPSATVSRSQPSLNSSTKKQRLIRKIDQEKMDYENSDSYSPSDDSMDDFIDDGLLVSLVPSDDHELMQNMAKSHKKSKSKSKSSSSSNSVKSDSKHKSTSSIKQSSMTTSSPSPSLRLAAFHAESNSTMKDMNSLSQQTKSTLKSTPKSKPKPTSNNVPPGQSKDSGKWDWLENKRDKNMHLPDHPDYDPSTLYIPQEQWKKFTPFERQYWEIKSEHMDKVLFFAKGSFAEQYSEDAYLMHQVFDLKMTERVNMPMTGVPDTQIDLWAAKLLAQGYKVARVDQMETALGKQMREASKAGKKDKIIRRELTGIYTAGTLVDSHLLPDEMSSYCLAIKEEDKNNGAPNFGIAFVDTSTSTFHVTEFEDDKQRTKLETLLQQLRVAEIIVEKNGLSKVSLKVLKNNINSKCLWNNLKSGSEFWDTETTKYELESGKYFNNDTKMDMESDAMCIQDHNGSLSSIRSVIRDMPLATSALGAIIFYLRRIKLDEELLSLGKVYKYDPLQQQTSLILDGQTLANLEIFTNSSNGTDEGTVVKLLNQCITPYGKRMFKIWLCHPLYHIDRINERLDTVDDFILHTDLYGFRDTFEKTFTRSLDLERLISAIHGKRCKVKDFIKVLDGFKTVMKFKNESKFDLTKFKSKKLPFLLINLPDLSNYLEYFDNAFDRQSAIEDAKLVPLEGVEEEVDESLSKISEIEEELSERLEEYKKLLQCSSISFRDLGKEIYQVEVPIGVKVPKDWIKISGTKQVNRYYNSKLQGIIRQLQEAREVHSAVLKRFEGKVYERFDEHYDEWNKSVKIIAEIDCLLSLARSSMGLGEPSCRPEFVNGNNNLGKGFIDFKELRHPCIIPSVASDFIPNDVMIGGENIPSTILLTGPNMAGKSTLLRMTCIAVIMAQLGCYVPCRFARMTPIDRIMSRLGANDNIFASQSTFMVELNETSKIMRESTPNSLVIIDELGRGTNTLQGYAIAYAVLDYLTNQIGCLTAFATHYHQLAEEFTRDKTVGLRNMLCHVQDKQQVTFLYKLVEGIAPKSYGMNVASMAGVPQDVVERAEEIANEYERETIERESAVLKQRIRDILC